MDIEQEIDYMAHEIVVPITGEPTTPYEVNAVAKYKRELRQFHSRVCSDMIAERDRLREQVKVLREELDNARINLLARGMPVGSTTNALILSALAATEEKP